MENEIQEKQRLGCVTELLIVMIIANSLTAILYHFGTEGTELRPVEIPEFKGANDLRELFPIVYYVLSMIGVFKVIYSVSLYFWESSAFWGVAMCELIIFFINLSIGIVIWQSVFGLAAIAILFIVFKIKQNSNSSNHE
jgi:hypothetical protein